MMDLLQHFWQHWMLWNMKKWSWLRQGIAMRARSDYILGTDQLRFKMVVIRGRRNYPSYHFYLRARLLIFPTEAGHQCYPGGLPAQMVTVHGYR